MHVDSKTARKIGPLSARQKNTIRKVFRWRAHSGPRFGDTCSSDIHVVKETRACACHLPKGNSKIPDTCTAAQVDLSLSVGLWVAGTFKL